MKNPIPLQKGLKWPIVKVSPIVTKESSRCAKSCEDILFEEFNDHLGIDTKGGKKASNHLEI